MKLKKSHIIGGVVVVTLVALGSLTIFWPKASIQTPGGTEEHPSEPESTPVEGHETPNLPAMDKTISDIKLPSSTDPKMKKVENIVVHSRVQDQFKAMDDLLEAQLEQIQDAAQLSATDQEELDRLKKIISSENLLANYKKMLYEQFDEKELDHLNDLYQNPLISKLKDSQVYNQTPEGQKELMDYWKTFKPESLSAERLAALKEYDKQSGGTKNTVEMIERVGEMTGNSSKDPKHAKENAEFKKSMYTAVEQANLTSNAKLMANASEDEIKNTTKVVSDPTYQKASGIEQAVANGALTQVGEIMHSKAEKHDENNKSAKKDH